MTEWMWTVTYGTNKLKKNTSSKNTLEDLALMRDGKL
jgi:hypothetical protein